MYVFPSLQHFLTAAFVLTAAFFHIAAFFLTAAFLRLKFVYSKELIVISFAIGLN